MHLSECDESLIYIYVEYIRADDEEDKVCRMAGEKAGKRAE